MVDFCLSLPTASGQGADSSEQEGDSLRGHSSPQGSSGLARVLWGIQIMNEPNRVKFPPFARGSEGAHAGRPTSYTATATGQYTDLLLWYDRAIRRMRARGLPLEVAVVPFVWPWQLGLYRDRMEQERWLRFASDWETFGSVVWDTHLYVCNTNSPGYTKECSFEAPSLGGGSAPLVDDYEPDPGDSAGCPAPAADRMVFELRLYADGTVSSRGGGGGGAATAAGVATAATAHDELRRLTKLAYHERRHLRGFVRAGHRLIVGEWALAGVDDENVVPGLGLAPGAKLAIVMQTVAEMFAADGVEGHYLWTFGGRGVRNMGAWLVENVGASVLAAVESGRALGLSLDPDDVTGGSLAKAESAPDVFRQLWRLGAEAGSRRC